MILADCSVSWQSLTAVMHRGLLKARGFAGLWTAGLHQPEFGTVIRTAWCGQEDSNFHGLSPTTTSTLRVYQFRHDRKSTRASKVALAG